jgi:hypothetical protein
MGEIGIGEKRVGGHSRTKSTSNQKGHNRDRSINNHGFYLVFYDGCVGFNLVLVVVVGCF